MKMLYPLCLRGITKSPIWGGTRLLTEYGKTSEQPTIGESWELTVRDAENAVITNGCFSGTELRSLIRAETEAVMGAGFSADEPFPLLVKLIDANDRLSVQVHPDDLYAARVEHDRGKTEMWYILQADEGAELICGLADGVSTADFALAVREGRTETALRHLPVHAGETYFIPAGLPHAIGKGILLAEVQQNCDLTYRVYDYDRLGKDGKPRELHVQKALDVIRPYTDTEIEQRRYSRTGGTSPDAACLAACEYFRVDRIFVTDTSTPLSPCGKMRYLLCLSGKITLQWEDDSCTVETGIGCLLPAAMPNVTLQGTGTALLCEA